MNEAEPVPTNEVGVIKPMGSVALGLTALSSAAGTYFFVASWAIARGGYIPWEIGLTACQVAAYALVLARVVSRYASGCSLRRVFAVRGTSPTFYAIALIVGLSAALWLNALYGVVLTHFPLDLANDDHIAQASIERKVAYGICLACITPMAEEAMFRGALFATFRKAQPASNAIIVTSIVFCMVHVRWQIGLPILPLALSMGVLRQWSGSIIPSLLLHMTFNGLSFAASASPEFNEQLDGYLSNARTGSAISLIAGFVTMVALYWAYTVSKGARAVDARALDT